LISTVLPDLALMICLKRFLAAVCAPAPEEVDQNQASHLQYELQIDFMEAVFGEEKTISINRLQECELLLRLRSYTRQ